MRLDGFEIQGWPAAGLRWLAAGTLVLAFHAGVIVILDRQPEPATTVTGGETVEVDLEPVEGEKAPQVPAETSGDPATAAAAAADSAAAVDAPAPTSPVLASQPPEPVTPPLLEPPKIEPVPAPPPEPPKLEPMPPPPPKPPKLEPVPVSPPEPKVEQVQPTPIVPKVPADAPMPRPTPQQSHASAASAATAAADEAAPAVQRLSAGRETAWRGKLVSHLNRFRRFPPGLGSGTTRVGFTIDAEGRVTATDIVTGSGNLALDAAARALIERASPFPPPPAGVSGKGLSFVVPIHFDGHRP